MCPLCLKKSPGEVSAFPWHVRSEHRLSGLHQHPLIPHNFHGSGVSQSRSECRPGCIPFWSPRPSCCHGCGQNFLLRCLLSGYQLGLLSADSHLATRLSTQQLLLQEAGDFLVSDNVTQSQEELFCCPIWDPNQGSDDPILVTNATGTRRRQLRRRGAPSGGNLKGHLRIQPITGESSKNLRKENKYENHLLNPVTQK